MLGRRAVIALAVVLIAMPYGAVRAGTSLLQPSGQARGDKGAPNKVFVGWVDLNPAKWHAFGYSSEDEWKQTIVDFNDWFRGECEKKYLKGMKVGGATAPGQEAPADYDLFIRFSPARIDYEKLDLTLTVDFINPGTKEILSSIPEQRYYKRLMYPWGFERYIYSDLGLVGEAVQRQVRAILQTQRAKTPDIQSTQPSARR